LFQGIKRFVSTIGIYGEYHKDRRKYMRKEGSG